MIDVTCDNCGKAISRNPSGARTKTLFCSSLCSNLFHGGRRKATAEQFWAKVAIGSSEECWEWTGYRRRDGYGQTSWMGNILYSHRLALSLTDGDWSNPLQVLHHCDNPPCCNPAHLFRGTQSQNVHDMLAKGRGRVVTLKGEASNLAKLTDDAVKAIRSSTASGPTLAREYNVSKSTISRVRKHQVWGHML